MDILNRIRPVIFGMEDGLVSMWGLVIGVAIGSQSSSVVVLAGLAGAVPAALSMAAGEYISSKSKREVQDSYISHLERKVKKDKKGVLADLKRHWIKDEKLTKSEAQTMAKIYGKSDERLVHHVFETEGVIESTLEEPSANALLMFISFIAASLFPIGPFMVYPIAMAQSISFIITGLALFGVGASKTYFTKQPWWYSGLEMLLIGAIAGAGGFVVGNFFA